jgi:hypothetical protein
LAQVSGFGAWIGPRLWPSILAAGRKSAGRIESG